MVGLAAWFVGDDIWCSGRWFLADGIAHQGVFRIEGDKLKLKMVLPSGPEFDFSYMGVARHPLNSARYMLSYYSNHTAPDDPAVDQWSHPQIYLVDALFEQPFVTDFRVSDVQALPFGLDGAAYPEPDAGWHALRAYEGENAAENGFADATRIIAGQSGVVYFVADIETGPVSRGRPALRLRRPRARLAQRPGDLPRPRHEPGKGRPAYPSPSTSSTAATAWRSRWTRTGVGLAGCS